MNLTHPACKTFIGRLLMIETVIDLLNDASQPKEAVDIIKTEVADVPSRLATVVCDNLTSRQHA